MQEVIPWIWLSHSVHGAGLWASGFSRWQKSLVFRTYRKQGHLCGLSITHSFIHWNTKVHPDEEDEDRWEVWSTIVSLFHVPQWQCCICRAHRAPSNAATFGNLGNREPGLWSARTAQEMTSAWLLSHTISGWLPPVSAPCPGLCSTAQSWPSRNRHVHLVTTLTLNMSQTSSWSHFYLPTSVPSLPRTCIWQYHRVKPPFTSYLHLILPTKP
jgi:hypothetical protein